LNSVLITGASGFIGRELCTRILDNGRLVRGTVRTESDVSRLPDGVDAISIASIDSDTNWDNILADIDTVVHLAARVHVMDDASYDPLAEYRKVNVEGTKCLAVAAANAEVKRFVYISSIKVNGEGRASAYTEDDKEAPEDPYGLSKWEAEQELHKISDTTGIEVVILRPPLVYGPGVKANFLELMKIVDKGTPSPLAKVDNRRSFIYIENLVDAVLTCIKHSGSAGQTYFVSDDEDVSTSELIRKIASALNKPARLFPFPKLLMFILGRLIGKGPAVDRLIGSLTVDISKIKQDLGWKPPFTMEHGLQKTAEWYKEKAMH
jgi:nucleoside-diphosphate-sugar epimerase